MTYGLSHAGYDIRIAQDVEIPGMGMVAWAAPFKLASAIEFFQMPNDLIAIVHDNSSCARQGLSVFNTVIDPGWKGYLTLDLANKDPHPIKIAAGTPIAQILFHRTTRPCVPYEGKYQNQPNEPVPAKREYVVEENDIDV